MIKRLETLLHMKAPKCGTEGLLIASGSKTPEDGTAGYAKGCIFQNTSSGSAYINKGTLSACAFAEISATVTENS